jgi:hypothetical protein
MPSVNVSYGLPSPTHDISLGDGVTTYGMIFAKGGTRVLQEFPLSPPAQAFENEQKNWIGGRGRLRFDDDPTGFFDCHSLWTTTEEKLFPALQWRFAAHRNANNNAPGDNHNLAWWKLYGNTPGSRIARYLSIIVSDGFNGADKGYLWIRRRGTPGTLTFELCNNSSGSPGTVITTVTKTVSDITDTVSVWQLFDWTGTQNLSTYHIKIYGASSDNAANHWEVLGNADGTSSKYSSDNSAWSAATISMYYRVTDADIDRQWRFFTLEGALYCVSQNDDGSSSVLRIAGLRGTASSATSTTLTNSAASMATDFYIGSQIRIFDGTGEGQTRTVTANTATQFTVSPAWHITPDTTSRYVVMSSVVTAPSGTPGLGALRGKPMVVGNIAYFPQGAGGSNIRRMRVNGNSHDFADDGTNKADYLYLDVEGQAPQIVAANAAASTIQTAPIAAWGVNLTLSTAKQIGSADYRITNLFSHNKSLKIFKEDGSFTYTNGIVERDGHNFSDVPDYTTGFGVGAQNGFLWWGWAHSIVRQAGNSVDDMLNFKRGYNGLPDDRKGYVSCIVSAVGWLFFVIDGGSVNYSSIIAWNGMGWHEIWRGWAPGVRVRNAYWQSVLGGRNRLWFDPGGDLAYIEFPQFAANPLNDSGVNHQHEGVMITSTYDAHDQNLYKVLADLRVFLETVGGGVEIDYQTNANVGTNTWTVLGTADSAPVEDVTLDLGEIFQIRFRHRLQTSNTRTPPVLTGWQLSGRMMPLPKYQFMCTFRADSDAETKTDEPDHNPDDLYEQLQTWARQNTKLLLHSTVRSVDNNTVGRSVTVALPQKSVRSLDTEENKWTGEISVAILET